jgi:hypothetical protein
MHVIFMINVIGILKKTELCELKVIVKVKEYREVIGDLFIVCLLM